jgi:HNH endonuclease
MSGRTIKWTEADKATIIAEYANISNANLAKRFGCEERTIKNFANRLGLYKSEAYLRSDKVMANGKTRREWTAEERETVRVKFSDMTSAALAAEMGRTVSSVNQQAALMGIKKSEAHLSSDLSGRISKMREFGARHRFAKGQPAINKGKKQTDYMTPEAIERTKKTRFQQGGDNGKQLPIGTITILNNKGGKVKCIILGNGKRAHLNRHTWAQAHGEIPKDMIIVHKDGDAMNCDLANLEMISKAENMRRNSVLNLPPEIKEATYDIAKLTRKINFLTKKTKRNGEES